MTLAELSKIVEKHMKQERNHDLEVCIPNNKGGFGGTSVTSVKSAYAGIDWDKGKFFINPTKPMIENDSQNL